MPEPGTSNICDHCKVRMELATATLMDENWPRVALPMMIPAPPRQIADFAAFRPCSLLQWNTQPSTLGMEPLMMSIPLMPLRRTVCASQQRPESPRRTQPCMSGWAPFMMWMPLQLLQHNI